MTGIVPRFHQCRVVLVVVVDGVEKDGGRVVARFEDFVD
jgi:hypothetical protein